MKLEIYEGYKSSQYIRHAWITSDGYVTYKLTHRETILQLQFVFSTNTNHNLITLVANTCTTATIFFVFFLLLVFTDCS